MRHIAYAPLVLSPIFHHSFRKFTFLILHDISSRQLRYFAHLWLATNSLLEMPALLHFFTPTATTHLLVLPRSAPPTTTPPAAQQDDDGWSTASEVGSVIGGVAGVLALAVAIWFAVKQIRRWTEEDQRLAEEARRRSKKWYRFPKKWFK